MTDRYERIRAALAMGPTPGPWLICPTNSGTFVKSERVAGYLAEVRNFRTTQDVKANARLIAACDPDTIRALLAERDALQAEVDELKVVAKCASEQQDSLFSEARTLNERADKLEEALRLIESAKDRGFGIDYARGVAQSALGSRACRVDGEGE